MQINGYQGVKVFSATKMIDRQHLGEMVSDWIRVEQPEIVNTIVTQSSDTEFHCLAITIFYNFAQGK